VKKFFIFTLVLAFSFSIALIGCEKKAEAPKPASAPTITAPTATAPAPARRQSQLQPRQNRQRSSYGFNKYLVLKARPLPVGPFIFSPYFVKVRRQMFIWCIIMHEVAELVLRAECPRRLSGSIPVLQSWDHWLEEGIFLR